MVAVKGSGHLFLVLFYPETSIAGHVFLLFCVHVWSCFIPQIPSPAQSELCYFTKLCSVVGYPPNKRQREREKMSTLFCSVPLSLLSTPLLPLCHLFFLSLSHTFSPTLPTDSPTTPHCSAVNRRSLGRFTAVLCSLAASVTAEI